MIVPLKTGYEKDFGRESGRQLRVSLDRLRVGGRFGESSMMIASCALCECTRARNRVLRACEALVVEGRFPACLAAPREDTVCVSRTVWSALR